MPNDDDDSVYFWLRNRVLVLKITARNFTALNTHCIRLEVVINLSMWRQHSEIGLRIGVGGGGSMV